MKSVRGAPTSSINKNDMAAISDELKIHWNGPPINMCSSVVRQTLNWHFNGNPWHFIDIDIHAKFHKVSVVVDRLNNEKPPLPFMS